MAAFLAGLFPDRHGMRLLGYFGIRGLWRYSVVRSWRKRKLRILSRIPGIPLPGKADKK